MTHALRIARLLGRLSCIAVLGLAWAGRSATAQTTVYSVNYPIAYFAERIGGDAVTVRFPAPADIDPAFWEPAPEEIAAYQSADLILLNGAGYARWISGASLPRRRLVDTSRIFRDAYLARSEAPVHQHGPAGEHAHGQIAFTTWLDPEQAIAQARAIEAAFRKLRPEEAIEFTKRANALVQDLERLDCEFATALAPLATAPLLASHPVYAYLARRYGLDLRSVTWEPNLDPGETAWRGLDAMLAERSARWMFWESMPLDSVAQKLSARRVGVLVFETAANRPAAGDYLSLMEGNLRVLRKASGQQPGSPASCVRSE